jgi:hypothetical protein
MHTRQTHVVAWCCQCLMAGPLHQVLLAAVWVHARCGKRPCLALMPVGVERHALGGDLTCCSPSLVLVTQACVE